MIDLLAVIGFIVLGLFFWGIFHVLIPTYLANKAAKLLFPSLCTKPVDDRFWHFFVFPLPLLLIISLSLLHFGLDLDLQIPTWFPWAPEGLHHMYHRFAPSVPVAVFIGRFIVVLFFSWRMKIKDSSSQGALP